ncbi:valine--pyruvate transaminase [Candidatus Njordibacter sp. Uisw_002]|jgi:valine--pyruvate aminotransferase|uniref:valine--pyruvate transaminase n=1 Tax=Candidatus Njordibacter sp. Uisw_002 TaxID=3230971 RepID=UPI002977BA8C|nr:valine--pyruvate transaminase [Oceanospirillaceae bacterium]|tara:strand:+ start:18310 stop:19569 length:1260 start_codon:yes stop_codon:yes gene_type:complete
MNLSAFGKKFGGDAGITTLMDDISSALSSGRDTIMMGGGNPANIPEIEAIIRQRLKSLANDPASARQLLGSYDPPQGNSQLIDALAHLFSKKLGWPITRHNIALTNGSQSAFFMLFNMLAGEFEDGTHKQIQLPMAPEYIGYADAGIAGDLFTAAHPTIDQLELRQFKYRVQFDHLNVGSSTGAICVSRPTNPTGNVITDEEVEQLDALAQANKVPLIIDGAYGLPFPGLIYTPATPFWNDNTIVCLSLSKFGLPGVRTGIVIANEETIQTLAGMNAIINLASGSFGAALTTDLIKSGEIIDLSQKVIRPAYEAQLAFAQKTLHRLMDPAIPYLMHKPEGTMFLWLWFKDMPISSQTLYERLKNRGVIVVSGHHFFVGITDDWQHQHECIRINYAAQNPQLIAQGMGIIAEEVRRAYIS